MFVHSVLLKNYDCPPLTPLGRSCEYILSIKTFTATFLAGLEVCWSNFVCIDFSGYLLSKSIIACK